MLLLRRGAVLGVFAVIIYKRKWKVILLLLIIYLLYRFQGGNDVVEQKIEEYSAYLDRQDDYYLKRYRALNKLRGRYPDRAIDESVRDLVKQLLYRIPLPPQQEKEWIDLLAGQSSQHASGVA